MEENKQNSETEKTSSDKATTSGSAASTKQAKDENFAAKDTLDTAKETAGQMANLAMGQVKEKAGSVIDEQKTNLASGINTVADSIRQIGENLRGDDDKNQIAAIAAKYGDTLAGQVEKFSSYIDDKELRELVRDVEQFARRNPALFIGGAFALGIMAARFLKSSGQSSKKRSQN